ncbi:SH2 domain-containing protein 4A-like isoform X1 [Huso huso]|uniref:SH2 domain-containing protein 4A-like isoform X1 n=1 Tax=Huso huso TaxID=61971 RepID=A0ABR0YTN0_HUSHU
MCLSCCLDCCDFRSVLKKGHTTALKMLQQILKEMYIDPDVLEALNEEQKKILFLKMRQEQVRRWTEREENFEKQRECLNSPKPKQASPKSVSWLLGNDGDVHVCVIGEAAGAKPYDLIHSQADDKRETNNHNARAPVSETFQKTECQISTPQEDGIQLNFQTAEKEEDTADPITELKDSGLYYRPHLQHKEPQSLALRLSARDRQEEKAGRDFKIVPAARRPMLSSDSEEANQSPDNPTAQGRVAELRKNFNHLQVTSGKNTLSRVKPPLPAKPTTFQLMSSAGFR